MVRDRGLYLADRSRRRRVLAQPAAPTPLPDGYMRAPSVAAGLAEDARDGNHSGGARIRRQLQPPATRSCRASRISFSKHNITSGYVTGLGGLSGALLVWGDPEVGAFEVIPVDEKCELISLLGHIAVRDGKPYVHLHAVVGFRDGSTKAGHVMEARVAPLAEISVVATSIGGASH